VPSLLKSFSWRFVERRGRDETFTAEYVTLTKLQKKARVKMDRDLVHAGAPLVPVASCEDLLDSQSTQPSA